MLHRPDNPIAVLGRIDGSSCAEAGAAAAEERCGLDVLLVSTEPLWPLDRDDRGIGCRVARELSAQGMRVGVASATPTPGHAQAWLTAMLLHWPEADGAQTRRFLQGWAGPGKDLRHRLTRRDGLRPAQLAGVVALIDRNQPRLIIGLGPHAPALLAGAKAARPQTRTLWLAPDCTALSALRRTLDLNLRHVPAAALQTLAGMIHAAAFARRLDRVVGYTPADTAALRLLTLTPRAATLRRGVNLKRYFPAEEPVRPRTAVTWAPDLADPATADALVRFAKHVWPRLLEHFPDARWRILGPHAPASVRALQRIDGIKLVGPLADVRQYVRRCRVVLLPTRGLSHGGKPLAEALALGMPTVAGAAAARALGVRAGARPTAGSPLLACWSRRQWFEAVARLWSDGETAAALGREARRWASEHLDRARHGAQWRRVLGLPDAAFAEQAELHEPSFAPPAVKPRRAAPEARVASPVKNDDGPMPEATYRRAA